MKRNATSTTGLSQASAGADTSVGRGCLLLSRQDATGPYSHRMSRHRPGSALILVLVCLVMMVLIGTAYIQVARVDRRATAQLTGVNNLDTVRDAVIAYMQKVLKEDLLDDSSNLFSAAAYDESYDYPFTNRDVTFAVTSGSPNPTPGVGAGIGTAVGGRFDDTWLASTYTDVESRIYPTWSHVSNLNGVFINLPSTSGGILYPQEVAVNGTGVSAGGTKPLDGYGEAFWNGSDNWDFGLFTMPVTGNNVNSIDLAPAGYERYGADTDGDGILDARWTWAPEEVRQIGALTYVVAYRIIDMSSLVNINVATALTSDGTTIPNYTNGARGYWPSDIDLSRLLSRARGGNAAWMGEMRTNTATASPSVFSVRGLTGAASPMLPGVVATFSSTDGLAQYDWAANLATKASAWNNPAIGSKYYGFPNNRFNEDSELELRARGGLNTATVAPIENSMPVLLRRDNTVASEVNYGSAAVGTTGSVDRIVHSFMSGAPSSPNEGTSFIHASRNFPEIRHMLTTMNGASVLAPQYAGWTQGVSSLDRLKFDLVYRNKGTSNATARSQEIADRLKKIFKIGTPLYLGLSATEADQVATEFAVAIQDYSDPDRTPTGLDVGGTIYYGLEVMPFLREFYVQAAYESATPGVDGASNPIYTERKLKSGSGAFVIEIGNPFDKACSFAGGGAGVSLRVIIRKEGNATPLVSYDVPPSVQDLPPRDNSETTEQLIFYSTPATPVTDGVGKGADLLVDLGLNTAYPANKRVEITTKLPDSALDDSPLTAELQIEVSSGVFITYDRLRIAGMKLPDKYTQNHGDGTTPEVGHAQISLLRDGQKNRYLSNRGIKVNKGDAAANSYVGNKTSISHLGADNKTVTGDTNLDKIQLAHSDHQIFNVAELGYIFMYGFFDGDLGDFPTRFSGKDGVKGTGVTTVATDTACPSRHFLSLTADGSTTGTVVVPNSTKIPHFSMVMDQFTTLSPRWDGVDNDNDGVADNDAEQFVPGLINVNTMPSWLMGVVSPLPESATDIQTFYQAIAEYRDFPDHRQGMTGNVSGLRTDIEADKGIAAIGEILMIKGRRGASPGTATLSAAGQTFRYGTDGSSLSITNALRHYPHGESDAVAYDTEEYPAQERMARFQFLSNTLTTRSDQYCAYVIIRGYNSAAFNTAPAESLSFFVLLDRSKIIDIDSAVTVYPKTGQKN